ncbi:MAG: hypothetical protein SGARI_001323 [Bacillariaceae sp.]
MEEPEGERSVTQVGDMTVDEEDYNNVLPVVQMIYDYFQNAAQDEDVMEDEEAEGWVPPTLKEVFEKTVNTKNSDSSNRVITFCFDWEGYNVPESVWDFVNDQISFLPESISLLDALEYLQFSDTWGGIPSLPGNISNLKNLKELNVSHIGLEQLPEDLGALVSLKKLNLQSNSNLHQLPGAFPPHLEDLDLLDCEVGALSESVCSLVYLKKLAISFLHLRFAQSRNT